MNNWKDKILEGYTYSIGNSTLIAVTGFLGAIAFGETCEAVGFSDEEIQKSIKVCLGKNYISLDNLKIIKNDNRN